MNGESPLYAAARCGNTAAVKLLLANGAAVNQANKHGETPLYAASTKHTAYYAVISKEISEVIKTLLANNANVNQANNKGETPLYGASERWNSGAVKELLIATSVNVNQRNNNGETPLYAASKTDYSGRTIEIVVDVVKELLLADLKSFKMGPTEDFTNFINAVIDEKSFDKLAKYIGDTPLHTASHMPVYGYDAPASSISASDVIKKLLLANGVNVNQANNAGQTPLYYASYYGNTRAIKELLANNANVNQADRHGFTPLNIALIEGHIYAAKELLLANGVNVSHAWLVHIPSEIIESLVKATAGWLFNAKADEMTANLATQLKPFKKQLFEVVKKLPFDKQKEAARLIFDETKDDKKNLTTAFGKVFCQGGASVNRPSSQLGSIYEECMMLGLIKRPEKSSIWSSFFGQSSKDVQLDKKLEISAEGKVNTTFLHSYNNL